MVWFCWLLCCLVLYNTQCVCLFVFLSLPLFILRFFHLFVIFFFRRKFFIGKWIIVFWFFKNEGICQHFNQSSAKNFEVEKTLITFPIQSCGASCVVHSVIIQIFFHLTFLHSKLVCINSKVKPTWDVEYDDCEPK